MSVKRNNVNPIEASSNMDKCTNTKTSLLKSKMIIHHYCAYANVFLLVCLSVLEFASIGLTLVNITNSARKKVF